MATTERILKTYRKASRIVRDHMWIRFITLRDQFDDIEHYGTAANMESTALYNQTPLNGTGNGWDSPTKSTKYSAKGATGSGMWRGFPRQHPFIP